MPTKTSTKVSRKRSNKKPKKKSAKKSSVRRRSKKKSAKKSPSKTSRSSKSKASVSKSQKADFYIGLQENHFLNVVSGLKTVEGRLNKGKFVQMKKGNTIIINGQYKTKITKIVKYKTFRDYLEKETLAKTLPGVYTIDDGVAVCRQYYTEVDEWEFGVIAIHLAKGSIIPLMAKKGVKKK